MTPITRPAVMVAAGAGLLTIGTFIPVPALRVLLVIVPALVVPGAAVFLGLGVLRGRWDPVPTLALGAMTSLAFYPLAALLLYVAHIRLSRTSLVVVVDGLVLAMIVVDARRRSRRPSTLRPILAAIREPPGETRRWARWLGTVVLCCAGSLALGARFLPAAAPAPFTEFSLTGPMAKLTGPISVTDGSSLSVPISVHNASPTPRRYVLAARLDGATLGSDRQVPVPREATWSGSFTGDINAPGCLNELVLELLARPGGTPIASIDLWIRTRSAGCLG
jgi:uncharacterized membrane protein